MNNSESIKFLQLPPSDDDIYMDDMPVDHLIYKNSVIPVPKPADLTLLWSGNFPMTSAMKKALAGILVNRINIAFSLKKIKEAELILLDELYKAKENPSLKLKIMLALIGLYEKMDPDKRLDYYQKAKEIISDNEKLISKEALEHWTIMADKIKLSVSPFELRATAFDFLESGHVDDAEMIYYRLLNMKFELPGTLCHLARVQLLKHKLPEAAKSVHDAWKLRDKASGYVLLRILFFKIFFLLLNAKDPSAWVNRLKKSLAEAPVFMEWNISTTLKTYQSELKAEDNSFLTSLTKALQRREDLWVLEKYELWNRS